MTYTDEERKTKWCPKRKHLEQQHQYCVGKQCMMWIEEIDYLDTMERSNKGYCGLVTKR